MKIEIESEEDLKDLLELLRRVNYIGLDVLEKTAKTSLNDPKMSDKYIISNSTMEEGFFHLANKRKAALSAE